MQTFGIHTYLLFWSRSFIPFQHYDIYEFQRLLPRKQLPHRAAKYTAPPRRSTRPPPPHLCGRLCVASTLPSLCIQSTLCPREDAWKVGIVFITGLIYFKIQLYMNAEFCLHSIGVGSMPGLYVNIQNGFISCRYIFLNYRPNSKRNGNECRKFT